MNKDERFEMGVFAVVLLVAGALIGSCTYTSHLETMARIGKHCTEQAK